jgi:hypothetical protein
VLAQVSAVARAQGTRAREQGVAGAGECWCGRRGARAQGSLSAGAGAGERARRGA